MWSPAASSRASADLPPGTLIAGFRLERVIGHGSQATVYDATQLTLDRRVALKVIRDRALAERVRRLTWPEHPGAVSLFGAGDSEHGPWLAMWLVSGETLETARAPLGEVAAALAAAHAAGIVHGGVTARNVLVREGRAYLSDFGLAPGQATADEDRAALARLVRDHPPPSSHRRATVLAGAAATVAAVVLVGLLAGGSGSGGSVQATPPAPAGTRPIGSDLAPGDVESVDCNGRPPDGASLPCTVSQLELAGRETVAPRDGTITSWAVRGARGSLSLQVLRGRGRRLIVVDQSAAVTVRGPAPHVSRTAVAVAAGDRLALDVAPDAAVGIRRGGSRTSTERWFSPLHGIPPPRAPERAGGTGFDHELLLRADVSPKTDIEAIEPLRGRAAARAATGLQLASRDVDVDGGEVRTVTLVSLGSAVAVDLFDGARRLARTPLPGADGRGRLGGLAPTAGSVRIRWRNPDGAELNVAVQVTAGGLGRSGRTS